VEVPQSIRTYLPVVSLLAGRSLNAITPQDVERFKSARSLERKTVRAGKDGEEEANDEKATSRHGQP